LAAIVVVVFIKRSSQMTFFTAISSIRYVGSLRILAAIVVVVFIKGSSQMAFFTAISISSCGLFYCKAWHL
jgi:hypothetical protein